MLMRCQNAVTEHCTLACQPTSSQPQAVAGTPLWRHATKGQVNPLCLGGHAVKTHPPQPAVTACLQRKYCALPSPLRMSTLTPAVRTAGVSLVYTRLVGGHNQHFAVSHFCDCRCVLQSWCRACMWPTSLSVLLSNRPGLQQLCLLSAPTTVAITRTMVGLRFQHMPCRHHLQ